MLDPPLHLQQLISALLTRIYDEFAVQIFGSYRDITSFPVQRIMFRAKYSRVDHDRKG